MLVDAEVGSRPLAREAVRQLGVLLDDERLEAESRLRAVGTDVEVLAHRARRRGAGRQRMGQPIEPNPGDFDITSGRADLGQ